MERKAFLDLLEDSYTAYYNIVPSDWPEDFPLAFKAEYFSRDERYFLTKKIQVWANETNEYAFIFSADSFDTETIDRCTRKALEEMLPKVKPHKEHQNTNAKVLFVADSFDKSVIKHIEKLKFERSYNHSFYGYSALLAAAVDLSQEKAYPNKAGHDLSDYFSKLFAAANKSSCESK